MEKYEDLRDGCDVEFGGRLFVDSFTSGLKYWVQQKGAQLKSATPTLRGQGACLLGAS